MDKTYRTIQVRPNTHRRVLLFRIRSKVANMDEAIKELFRIFKEYRKLTR